MSGDDGESVEVAFGAEFQIIHVPKCGCFCLANDGLNGFMILIISSQEDAHANLVRDALQSVGQRSEILSVFGFPTKERISLHLSGTKCSWWMRTGCEDISAIWYRRNAAINHLSSLEPGRMDVIEQEYISARRACYSVLEESDSLWVNEWKNAWSAENKAMQLRVASSVGFCVPETLISNDPAQIQEFCARHQEAGVVHKMFHQAKFGRATSCTAIITPTVLKDEKLLGDVPGIYQPRIDLEFDLRVLVAGQSFIAARLQSEDKRFVDSRIMAHRKGCVHAWDLDEGTKKLCLDMLDRLGLVSASIDLGMTRDGRLVFFEVNQAGNFLWMEQCNEDLPLLDFYCRFLMSGDSNFEYGFGFENRLALASFAN